MHRFSARALLATASLTAVFFGDLHVALGQNELPTRESDIRAGFGWTIVATRRTATRQQTVGRAAGAPETPRPRLAGFSPLIAIATSDAAHALGQFEHVLASSYVGQPLAGSDTDYVVGYLDSGADVDLVAGSAAEALGLFGSMLTSNSIPIGGVGGQVNAAVTMPLGFFAAGLSAVSESGQLDFGALVGHWNVSGLVAPPIECANGEALTAVIGTPFLAFYNSIIRVDSPQHIRVGDRTLVSPDVEIQSPAEQIPEFPHLMPMELGGLSPLVTTASYFPELLDLSGPPFLPTLLSLFAGTIPTGGLFFTTIVALEGPPTPLNPARPMRVLVDLGAQSSVISRAMAGALSLPLPPDFTVDVCGVGGLVTDVPSYYVDFVAINSLGGPLLFAEAPFVVLDLPSPEGGVLDGILGMNFFWNRNLIFEPALGASAFLHISHPIPVAYGDNDVDFDVDLTDAKIILECMSGPGAQTISPECDHLDRDQDGDIDVWDVAQFQRCFSGSENTADPACAE